MVNEARYGFSGGTSQFYTNMTQDNFACDGPGCTGSWRVNLLDIGGTTLTGPQSVNGPSTRYTPSTVYEDTLTWLKGKHTVAMGGSYTHLYGRNWNANRLAPDVTFGVSSADPAYSFLSNSANYPGGLSTAQQGYARNLYAMLTGRVTEVAGLFYLDPSGQEYVYVGDRQQEFSVDVLGLFVSDSWRVKPNLTLTGGLRWELQFPFQPDTDNYARLQDWQMIYGLTGPDNLFKPGQMNGQAPVLVQYKAGERPYNMDINNVAPSVGTVWRPNVGTGFLSKILTSEPVLRGGYSVSYDREGFAPFTSIFGSNPGGSRAGTRSIALGNLGTDAPLPVLFSQTGRFGAPATPTVAYPFTPAINETMNVYDPNYRTAYTHQWSLGFQRELGKNMALEVRYIGNRNISGTDHQWNLNDSTNWNIYENGFYDEFRKAQSNMRANIAAGKGNTFAYTGAPGTAPLPIFQAYFAGIPLTDARNQNPANYTQLQLHQLVVVQPAASLQPEHHRDCRDGHQRPAELVARGQREGRRLARQLLPGQPDRAGERILVEDQRGCHHLRRPADRAAAPHEQGAAGAGQLQLRRAQHVVVAVAA